MSEELNPSQTPPENPSEAAAPALTPETTPPAAESEGITPAASVETASVAEISAAPSADTAALDPAWGEELSANNDQHSEAAAAAQPFVAPEFSDEVPAAEVASIDLLDDVELNVKIELGRTQMYIEDVLKLHVGSVIVLDKLAGDPVDIYVNERLVARGEVLVLNDNFCVRINDILSPVPELEGVK